VGAALAVAFAGLEITAQSQVFVAPALRPESCVGIVDLQRSPRRFPPQRLGWQPEQQKSHQWPNEARAYVIEALSYGSEWQQYSAKIAHAERCKQKIRCRDGIIDSPRIDVISGRSGEGPMNPVSVVAPNVGNGNQSLPAQGLQSATPASSPQSPDGSSTDNPPNGTNGPSVTVDLSQHAKSRLARANENQAAANRILAFVDKNRASRSHHSDGANDSWSNGKPSLEQEYQDLTGNSSQTSDNPQASQDETVTITLSEYSEASVSVESGSGATTIAASAASAQYDSVSVSVNVNTGSIEIVQSDQSQTEATAQVGSASPLSITA
jgi:hypothetical protein